jgi:hypothetical protein
MNRFKSYELKIKSVSLALEGQLIHRNEARLKRQIARVKASTHAERDATLERLRSDRDKLREHRKGIVRHHARNAFLAYGFLNGRAYAEIEARRFSDPDWKAIEKMVSQYGIRDAKLQDIMQSFERWRQEAPKPSSRD